MNMNRMKRALSTTVFAAAVLLFAVGCKTDNQKIADGFFPEPGAFRGTEAAIAAQTANGARADAMLYPFHFNGGVINSLGTDKIQRLLNADAAESFTLYLNVPTTDATLLASRQASVASFLKDMGVVDNQVQIATGPNPDTWAPANPQLTRMVKTESGGVTDVGGNAESTQSDMGSAFGGK